MYAHISIALLLPRVFISAGVAQDDVVQFLSRLDVEAVETPIGAFNELYRCSDRNFFICNRFFFHLCVSCVGETTPCEPTVQRARGASVFDTLRLSALTYHTYSYVYHIIRHDD